MADAKNTWMWIDLDVINLNEENFPSDTRFRRSDNKRDDLESMWFTFFEEIVPVLMTDAEAQESEYWQAVDQEAGVDYRDGLQRVFETVYGESDAIRIDPDGNGGWHISNGRHRLLVAKEMGLKQVPVIVYA